MDPIFMSAHSQFLLFCETRANMREQNFVLQEANKKLEEKKVRQKENTKIA